LRKQVCEQLFLNSVLTKQDHVITLFSMQLQKAERQKGLELNGFHAFPYCYLFQGSFSFREMVPLAFVVPGMSD